MVLLAGLVTGLVALQEAPEPGTSVSIERAVHREGAPPCTVEATARITVAEAPVDVVLRWQLDGRDAGVQEATLRSAGDNDLERTFRVRQRSGELSVTVDEPNSVSTDPVRFTVDCPPDEGPAPAEPRGVSTPVGTSSTTTARPTAHRLFRPPGPPGTG